MFKYTVQFWDSFDDRNKTEQGIVTGSSYDDATAEIEEYYGCENIISMSVERLSNLIIKEDVKNLFKEIEENE